MKTIKKLDKKIYYKVIEKPTKHSYIKVDNGFLIITKSKMMDLDYILKNIYKKFDYYYQIVQKEDEDTLYLWGVKYKITINESKSFNYQIKDNEIIVNSNVVSYQPVKEAILKNELYNYLKENYETIKKHLIKNGYYLVPKKLKYLKSKYGSYNYSKKGEYIVLNIFLATLKEEYLLYVLYHEYAHQKVKNHQREFYEKLKVLFPEHEKYRKQLKNYKLII